jgi:hypothetical protein
MRRAYLAWMTAATTVIVPLAVSAQSPYRRGDANTDGSLDIGDPIATLSTIFRGVGELTCRAAADANGDDGIDISDPVYSLVYLFRGGAAPPAPFPDCAWVPIESLSCESYPAANCPVLPPTSSLPTFIAALWGDGPESCRFDGLGSFEVRAGRCTELGGAPAGGPFELVEEPPLIWVAEPPPVVVDRVIPVSIATTLELDADTVVFDLLVPDPEGGIWALEASRAPLIDGIAESVIDVSDEFSGPLGLRATAWKSDALVEADLVESVWGIERTIDPRPLEFPRAIASTVTERPFVVGVEHGPLVDLSIVLSGTQSGDPVIAQALDQVLQRENALILAEKNANGPNVRAQRDLLAATNAELAETRVRLANARRAKAAHLAAAAHAFTLLEKVRQALGILDTYFTPAWLDKLKELITSREALLAGVRASDRDELDQALADKRSRLEALRAELESKRAQLETLEAEHEALKEAVRDAFNAAKATLGNHIGDLVVRDDGASFRLYGLAVAPDGSSATPHVPTSAEFRAREAELKAKIAELSATFAEIEACKSAIENLEKEEAELAANVAKLEAGASEIAEIDEILDAWFHDLADPPSHLPHAAALLARLRACGLGDFADALEALFGDPPRTCAELEDFRRRLEDLRARLAARAAELDEERLRAIAAAEAEEEKARQEAELAAEQEAESAAQGGGVGGAAGEETAGERGAYGEAVGGLEGGAAARSAKDRMRELQGAAQGGDQDALAELAQLVGLGLIDEFFPNTGLGAVIGGVLTIAELPECRCRVLKAFRQLLLSRDGTDAHANASLFLLEWTKCAGLPPLSGIAVIGGDLIADRILKIPRELRIRMAKTTEDVICLRCMN